jgi:hypothetical protein
MNTEVSAAYAIAAVRESAFELGFEPLDAATVERVVDYGLEALIECTLAAQQSGAIDINVRGVMYARSIERISAAIAAPYRREALTA